jgi:hypothetical protein
MVKFIKPDYELHHKNHNKRDNCLENLEPIKHDEHVREHIHIHEQKKAHMRNKKIQKQNTLDTIRNKMEY